MARCARVPRVPEVPAFQGFWFQGFGHPPSTYACLLHIVTRYRRGKPTSLPDVSERSPRSTEIAPANSCSTEPFGDQFGMTTGAFAVAAVSRSSFALTTNDDVSRNFPSRTSSCMSAARAWAIVRTDCPGGNSGPRTKSRRVEPSSSRKGVIQGRRREVCQQVHRRIRIEETRERIRGGLSIGC